MPRLASRRFGRIVSVVLSLVLGISPALQGRAWAAEATATKSTPYVVRELVEKRTANSNTYLLSTGALRTDFSFGPVN